MIGEAAEQGADVQPDHRQPGRALPTTTERHPSAQRTHHRHHASVTQTLGDGRTMGSYSLGQGQLNSAASTRFDDLLVQKIEKLQADYALKLQDALGSSKAARDNLRYSAPTAARPR
jgi:hypothetical protein